MDGKSTASTIVEVSIEDRLQEIWQQALQDSAGSFSEEEYEKLQAVATFEVLLAEVNLLSEKYSRRAIPKLLRRLDPMLRRLKFFSNCISIFIQSKPEVAALIWGSIYLVIQVSLQHQEDVDLIVTMLEYISEHMPRINSFVDLILVSKRIQNAICGLYKDLIQFFLQATVYLKRNPILNVLKISLPGRRRQKFQDQFAALFRSIQDHTQWIDSEANVSLHFVTQQLATRGREEILESIASIASSSTAVPPPPALSYRVLPHVANPLFYGRQHELQSLEDLLVPLRRTTLSIVSIVGEGGVGKSQIALQFCYSHFAEYSAIFWVHSETTVKLAQSYENIALEVGLIQGSENNVSLDNIREATKKWLKTTEHSWLLIYDNVDSLQHLNDYWPIGGVGSILLTTRDQNLSDPPISGILQLKSFSQYDSARFLMDNISSRDEGEETKAKNCIEISTACGGLPLALTQVVGYARALSLSTTEMRSLCSSDAFIDINSEINSLGRPDYYHPMGTSSLWQHALLSLNETSKRLVRILAHLDPDTIPYDLMGADINHRDTVELLSHSLLSRGEQGGCYNMHRLTQAAVLRGVAPEEMLNIFTTSLGLVNGHFPKYDENDRLINSWRGCKDDLPHVIRLSKLFSDSITYESATYLKLGELLERAGWYLAERQAWIECRPLVQLAEAVTRRGLHVSETNEGCNKDTLADLTRLLSDVTNTLGRVHMVLSNFDESLRCFDEAIAVRTTLGDTDNELIYMKRNLAAIYMCTGKVNEALVVLHEAGSLADDEFVAGRVSAVVYYNNQTDTLSLLSSAYLILGQYDKAWEVAIKATELCKSIPDSQGLLMADCYVRLCEIRKCQGQLEEAEMLALKALDMRGTALGPCQDTALALHIYATVLWKMSSDKAASTMRQASQMLRGIPDQELLYARSEFYVHQYTNDQGYIADSNLQEVFDIYKKHIGQTGKSVQADIKDMDFETHLPLWQRSYDR